MSTAKSGRKSARPAKTYGNRVDAQHHRKRILDAAVRILVDGSTLSMVALAKRSGYGRATVYRHFPSLQDVLDAIQAHAVDEIERAVTAGQLEHGTVSDALQRLFVALLQVGYDYRFLLSEHSTMRAETARALLDERLGPPILALVERGQASGELSQELPAEWIATVLGTMLMTTMREIGSGRLDGTEAARTAMATLLHSLRVSA